MLPLVRMFMSTLLEGWPGYSCFGISRSQGLLVWTCTRGNGITLSTPQHFHLHHGDSNGDQSFSKVPCLPTGVKGPPKKETRTFVNLVFYFWGCRGAVEMREGLGLGLLMNDNM